MSEDFSTKLTNSLLVAILILLGIIQITLGIFLFEGLYLISKNNKEIQQVKIEHIGGSCERIIEVKELKKNDDNEAKDNCIGDTKYEFSESEILELQQIALAEAEVQGIGGMAFVMQVVINRVNDERFPNTIHDVINQPGQFSTVDIYQSKTPTDNSYKALELLDILNNQGALYFEMNSGSSWQSNNLTYLFSYDNHNFYM